MIEISLFRTRLLSEVYSLLADLVDWSDKALLLKINLSTVSITDDDQYKQIAHDLTEAIKVRGKRKVLVKIDDENLSHFRIVSHWHVIPIPFKAWIHVLIHFKVFDRVTGTISSADIYY